jgi:hypothetical protein
MSAAGRLGESGAFPNVLRLRYAAQYGVSKQVIDAVGAEKLARMTPLARRVYINNTMRFNQVGHAIRSRGPTSARVQSRQIACTIAPEMWAKAFEQLLAQPILERPLRLGKKLPRPERMPEAPKPELVMTFSAIAKENRQVRRMMELASKLRVA